VTLLAGAALALLALSVPLVLLHLRRRPLAAIEVDSLRDWRRLPAASPSGRGRFSPPVLPLLLLLQLLALALLAFALAKPAGGGESAPSVHAYVVDESLWMGADEAGGGTRIESAQALLRRRLAALPSDGRVALVGAGASASVLYEGEAGGAAAALGELRAGAGQGSLDAGLRLAAGLRGSSSDPVLLLRAPEDPAPPVSGGGAALAQVVVGEEGQADLGVSAGYACAPADPESCDGLARVRNAGAAAATARLRIETEAGEAIERSLDIGAGEAAPVRFPLAPGQSAEATLQGGDALAADDSAAVAVPARAGLRVTLVGDPEKALPLARALAAVPGVKLRLRTAQSYKPSDPRTSDLLVFDQFEPHGGLPNAPALLLVDPPRLPGGAVGKPLEDSRPSGEAEGDPLLAGADLSALTIDEGAAERLALPSWTRAVVWSPEGPLLAAGSHAGKRVAIVAFQPSESNLPGLAGFAALVSNITAWASEWAPAEALAGETVAVDAPGASAVTLSGPGGERTLPVTDGTATATASAPGIYRLTIAGKGGSRTRELAVDPGTEPVPAAAAPVDLALLAAAPAGHGTEWWPWVLAAALLVLALELAYALRREPGAAWRGAGPRRRAATALAGLSLLLAALAIVLTQTGTSHRPATVVVDRSTSVGAVAEGTESPWLDAAGACGTRCPTVQFAAAAAFTAPGGKPLPARDGAPLGGGETDLRGALELGLARTPRGGRLDLLSDGYETTGDSEAVAAEARRRGVEIDALPLEERPADAGVTKVELPPALHAGDPVSVQVNVRSSAAVGATLTVERDGAEVGSERVELRVGDNPFVFSVKAPAASGSYVYTARVEAKGDEVPGNDALGTALRVESAPKVLVAGPAGSPIATMLSADGIDVESVAPSSLPSAAGEYGDVDAVVLENVSAAELGDERAAALAEAVRADALGLFVLGGSHSFSLGRYYSSPLEAALPVHSLVPGKLRRRRLALELALDRSGSMLDAVAGVPKIEMAQAAARGALKFVASRKAELGIVVFDARAKTLVPLTAVEDPVTEGAIRTKINRLLPEGGTEIVAGLEAAVAAIERSKATERHIILLSDGVSEAGDFRKLVPQLKRQKITVATVALGAEADTKLLGEIAKATGGNAHRTESPQELPRIFSKEARLNARPVRIKGTIQLQPGASSPIVSSILGEQLSGVRGNVVTTTKPGAEAALLGEDSGGRGPDPVLAQWTYGSGRVAVWTPGLDPQSAGVWANRPRLFQDAARWVERGVTPPPLTPAVRPGDLRQVVVETGGDAEQPTGGELSGSLSTPDGKTIELGFELRAPGEYVAATPRLAPGEYGYAVGDGARTTTGQLAVPYPAELRPGQPEATPLRALAAATGGSVLDPGGYSDIAGHGSDAWRWAALAALVAFFLGAALRLLGGAGRAGETRSRQNPFARDRARADRPDDPDRPADDPERELGRV
jgi:Ca-activated chloride channel family protein